MNRRQFLTGAPVALIPTAVIGAPAVPVEKVPEVVGSLYAGMPPGEYVPLLNAAVAAVKAMAAQWNELPPLRRLP